MSEFNNALFDFILLEHKNSYGNSSGVDFFADFKRGGSRFMGASITVLYDLNYEMAHVDLAITSLLDEFIAVFNIHCISDLHKIEARSIWELFEKGITHINCTVDQDIYSFSMKQMNGQNELFLDGRRVIAEIGEFTDPQSYLTYCLRRFHPGYLSRRVREQSVQSFSF